MTTSQIIRLALLKHLPEGNSVEIKPIQLELITGSIGDDIVGQIDTTHIIVMKAFQDSSQDILKTLKTVFWQLPSLNEQYGIGITGIMEAVEFLFDTRELVAAEAALIPDDTATIELQKHLRKLLGKS